MGFAQVGAMRVGSGRDRIVAERVLTAVGFCGIVNAGIKFRMIDRGWKTIDMLARDLNCVIGGGIIRFGRRVLIGVNFVHVRIVLSGSASVDVLSFVHSREVSN